MKSKINSIFLVLTLMVLFINCTPSNPTTPGNSSSLQPKLQFKANGVLYVCDAVADLRLGWVGYPRIHKGLYYGTNNTPGYSLSFCNTKKENEDGTWVVNFPFTQNEVGGVFDWGSNNSTLVQGTYNNSDMAINFFNSNFRYEKNPNSLTFVITSINSGLATGTFNGLLPGGTGTPNDGPQMTITDGVFSNVPVFE